MHIDARTPTSAPSDLGPLCAALEPDRRNSFDGVRDEDSMPLSLEPARFGDDLKAITAPRKEPT